MTERSPPGPETIRAIAAEVAGVPLDEASAAFCTRMLAAFMEELEALRALPLKEVEPAVIFEPVEHEDGGEP